MRPVRIGALVIAVLLGSCADPSPSAYVGGRATGGDISLGTISSGESCTQHQDGSSALIYCGDWVQPSGRVAAGGVAAPAQLAALATTGAWRSGLDVRLACGEPVSTTILGSVPAELLACTRRIGGWPQVALAAVVHNTVYYADGILPAAPVLERSIGILSGSVAAAAVARMPASDADALAARRLAAAPFQASDIGHYQALMSAGLNANLDENYVASEQAYRAALDLQRRTLGANDPALAGPLMQLALQLSDEGRSAEADVLFAQAAALASRSSSPTTQARLDHYRGLGLLDEDRPAEALTLLRRAETRYAALLSPELLASGPAVSAGELTLASGRQTVHASSGGIGPLEPTQQAALIGVIEARRAQAIALRDLGRTEDATRMVDAAADLAAARGLHQPNLTARLYRTEATIADAAQQGGAEQGGAIGSVFGGGAADMRLAEADFTLAQPGSRPLAQTYLLRAGQAMRGGDTAGAVASCKRGEDLLDQLHAGTSADLVAPCLDAYAAAAAKDPAQAQPLLSSMFEMSQLVQGNVTSQQIAMASARLLAGATNAAVGTAIRRQQDAALALAAVERQQDEAAQAHAADPGLPLRLADARATMADADAALQTAAPNYGQLVQQVASARDVLAALHPGEAFAAITLTRDNGWVFLLRQGQVSVAPLGATGARIGDLVHQLRESVDLTTATPPPFAIAAAQELYAATLGRVGPQLAGAQALVVAPAGPMLSLPMGLLLTGPADPADLAHAPWLIRSLAVSHVPAAANFVSLRRVAAASGAQPWFGFGDFRNVSLAQAQASFPTASCQDSAQLFADLPPLPFAQKELTGARLALGGTTNDELQGTAFTAPRVMAQDLRQYRVLHFATHALLPTDLRCESEPAIVTSSPPGAAAADGALLTASDVMSLQLDADLVIISACNSAGPDGSPAGESLSGLARAFFYAGARAVMVTHWSVNDQTSAYLVASTLKRLRDAPEEGAAQALRTSQLALLDLAAHGQPGLAHPFFWAAFALVGEDGFHAQAAAAWAATAGL